MVLLVHAVNEWPKHLLVRSHRGFAFLYSHAVLVFTLEQDAES